MYEVGLLCVVLGLLFWDGHYLIDYLVCWLGGDFMTGYLHEDNVRVSQLSRAWTRSRHWTNALAWCHQWREDAITLIARLEQLPEITIVQGDGTIY